jgi:hypothetical protein
VYIYFSPEQNIFCKPYLYLKSSKATWSIIFPHSTHSNCQDSLISKKSGTENYYF